MEQAGEYRIAASREQVWAALNDPEVLGACITGCQDVQKIDDTHFEVKVKAKVGPVNATFNAELALEDLNPPVSYTISGNVKGGPAGFGKGGASVALAEDGAETVLTYQVKGSVGGKLAQVGSRLVDGAARKMADEFFAAFTDHLNPASAAAEGSDTNSDTDTDTGTATPASTSETQTAPVEYESSGTWKVWVIAFVVLGGAIVLSL